MSIENANGNQEGVQDAICQALFVGMLFALVGGVALLAQPDKILGAVLTCKLIRLDYVEVVLHCVILVF